MREQHNSCYGIPVSSDTPTARDDESLAEAFWAVARRLRHQTRETLEPWDITPGQSRALGVLARHGAMRLSALAEHLRIAPALGHRGRRRPRRTAGWSSAAPTRPTGGPPWSRSTDEGDRVGAAIRAARRAEAERFFGAPRRRPTGPTWPASCAPCAPDTTGLPTPGGGSQRPRSGTR